MFWVGLDIRPGNAARPIRTGLEKARMRFAIQTVHKTMWLLLALAAASCGTHESPYVAYRAAFDKSMAGDVEQYLREVASRWDLVVHEQSKSVTRSDDVFVTFMYWDDRSYERNRWTLIVRNHDFGTDNEPDRSLISLAFFDKRGMPVEALDRLAFEIKHTLQDRFGLEFCRLNPARSVCDEEYKKLEEAREARLMAEGR